MRPHYPHMRKVRGNIIEQSLLIISSPDNISLINILKTESVALTKFCQMMRKGVLYDTLWSNLLYQPQLAKLFKRHRNPFLNIRVVFKGRQNIQIFLLVVPLKGRVLTKPLCHALMLKQT